jgi:cytoplasmic iron level regulating protein YaaA (DUF328/UPF0246 family)
MLILLPPSEGKNSPESGKRLNLTSLVAAEELRDLRATEIESHQNLDLTSCRPAHEIYSGVLYQALDWQDFSQTAKARGEKSILIISALFGLVAMNDVIPTYKAKIKSATWRTVISEYLDARGDDLIIDARSSTYQGVWTPPPSKTVAIRVFQIKAGKKSVITHMSKKYRGELTRLLLQKKAPTTPQELLAIAAREFDCELKPSKAKEPWYLDLLVHL